MAREVGKWKATVPQAVLESKARQLTVSALEDYRPDRGAAIGTFVTARLRKLSRSAYPHQNVARLPENQQLMFHTLEVANSAVLDRTGREATTEELADELGWTPKKVRTFQGAFGRRELVESEGLFGDAEAGETSVLDFYYHGLPPTDKLLFEDITGYGGKQPQTNSQLRRRYGLTQGQLSYRKKRFTDQMKAIQREQL
jgi:DNA-directed RNA polymerase sigma subunit (sigma70/sigma32)